MVGVFFVVVFEFLSFVDGWVWGDGDGVGDVYGSCFCGECCCFVGEGGVVVVGSGGWCGECCCCCDGFGFDWCWVLVDCFGADDCVCVVVECVGDGGVVAGECLGDVEWYFVVCCCGVVCWCGGGVGELWCVWGVGDGDVVYLEGCEVCVLELVGVDSECVDGGVCGVWCVGCVLGVVDGDVVGLGVEVCGDTDGVFSGECCELCGVCLVGVSEALVCGHALCGACPFEVDCGSGVVVGGGHGVVVSELDVEFVGCFGSGSLEVECEVEGECSCCVGGECCGDHGLVVVVAGVEGEVVVLDVCFCCGARIVFVPVVAECGVVWPVEGVCVECCWCCVCEGYGE